MPGTVLNVLCAIFHFILPTASHVGILIPIYRWGNWGVERLNDLTKSHCYFVEVSRFKFNCLTPKSMMLATTPLHCLYKCPRKMLRQKKIILLDTAPRYHSRLDRFEGTKDHIIYMKQMQGNQFSRTTGFYRWKGPLRWSRLMVFRGPIPSSAFICF